MASLGPNNPGTVISDNSNGAPNDWFIPIGITQINSSNNVYISGDAASGVGLALAYLKVTNFGFALPTSNIDGVTVTIERKGSTAATWKDTEVKLVVGGSIVGNNKADTGTFWGSSDAVITYGGAADSWGLTLTSADVNATTFGVVISCTSTNVGRTAQVDHITMTVNYTEGGLAKVCSISGGFKNLSGGYSN